MRRYGLICMMAGLSIACDREGRERRAETERAVREVRELAAEVREEDYLADLFEVERDLLRADHVLRDSSVENGAQWLHAVVTLDSTLAIAIRCQGDRFGVIAVRSAPRPRVRPTPELQVGAAIPRGMTTILTGMSGRLDSIAGPALGRGDTLTLTYTDTAGRALIRRAVRPFGDRVSDADWQLCR